MMRQESSCAMVNKEYMHDIVGMYYGKHAFERERTRGNCNIKTEVRYGVLFCYCLQRRVVLSEWLLNHHP